MSEDGYAVVPAHICPACGASDCLGSEMRDMPFEYRGESTVISADREELHQP